MRLEQDGEHSQGQQIHNLSDALCNSVSDFILPVTISKAFMLVCLIALKNSKNWHWGQKWYFKRIKHAMAMSCKWIYFKQKCYFW